jgi:hypothetical protein
MSSFSESDRKLGSLSGKTSTPFYGKLIACFFVQIEQQQIKSLSATQQLARVVFSIYISDFN